MFHPLKFIPVYKDYLWGGRNLEKLGRKLPDGIIAESWEVSAHPDGVSVVADGEYAGWTLPQLVSRFGKEVLGNALPEQYLGKFPLLIKLIDANQKLSVQVHPGDEYARIHENGEFGKTEMWYIISARPNAEIIYGLKPGVTREQFREAINHQTVENCLQSLKVTAGDVIYIPSGVIHALGEGIVLAEIQQNSNATYRVYDYERVDAAGKKRVLHIDKALDVIRFGSSPLQKHPKGISLSTQHDVSKTILSANPYFAVELYQGNGRINATAIGDRFVIYTFIQGEAVIDDGHQKTYINAPESVFIPATLGDYKLEGDFAVLKAYIPQLEEDVFKPLISRGFSRKEIIANISGLDS